MSLVKAFVMLGFSVCGGSLLAAPVGEVVGLRGEASAVLDGKSQVLSVGSKLEQGSEIRTGANGRAKLKFLDGSVIILSDGSVLKLERFAVAENGKRKEARFTMDVGLLSQSVAQAEGGSWSVRTPTVVTAVRGTEYIIEVKPGLETDVSIVSGEVAVNSLKKTRAIPVVLKHSNFGTSCDAEGVCQPSKPWSQERVNSVKDRLQGF